MLSVEAEFIDHHDHSRPLSGGEALDRQRQTSRRCEAELLCDRGDDP